MKIARLASDPSTESEPSRSVARYVSGSPNAAGSAAARRAARLSASIAATASSFVAGSGAPSNAACTRYAVSNALRTDLGLTYPPLRASYHTAVAPHPDEYPPSAVSNAAPTSRAIANSGL